MRLLRAHPAPDAWRCQVDPPLAAVAFTPYGLTHWMLLTLTVAEVVLLIRLGRRHRGTPAGGRVRPDVRGCPAGGIARISGPMARPAAGTEAINGIIELHRRIARGFRNPGNYRLRMILAADAPVKLVAD